MAETITFTNRSGVELASRIDLPPDETPRAFDLLVLHSPVDTVVGIENAERIFTSTRHPKSFVSLRQADHLLSRAEDAEYAGTMIGAWVRAATTRRAPRSTGSSVCSSSRAT